MPLNDHALLLQLERTTEAIEQKLDDVDIDPSCPEESRISSVEFDIDDLKTDLGQLEERLKKLETENQTLHEKVERLEKLAWDHDHPESPSQESRPGGKLPWEEASSEEPPWRRPL
jgi:predicted nuclease with TOPRIM domain